MKCYRCRKSIFTLNTVHIQSSCDDTILSICPKCAEAFIEILSRFKDFDPHEELVFWKGGS